MVPAFFAELVQGSIAAHVATRDAAHRPEILRAWAPRPGADGRTISVFVLASVAGRSLDNLAANGLVAVTVTRLSDYRTIQMKGRALGWRAARADERPLIEASIAALAAGADEEGLGDAVRRWSPWPALAIEIEVSEVYNQTPRPGTGVRLES